MFKHKNWSKLFAFKFKMEDKRDTTSKEFDKGKSIAHIKVLFKVYSQKIVKLISPLQKQKGKFQYIFENESLRKC